MSRAETNEMNWYLAPANKLTIFALFSTIRSRRSRDLETLAEDKALRTKFLHFSAANEGPVPSLCWICSAGLVLGRKFPLF